MNKLIVGFLAGLLVGVLGLLQLSGLGSESEYCVCFHIPATRTPAAEIMPAATEPPVATEPPAVAQPPAEIEGLAILGDSTQDEYQADNPRGGDYSATTYNWVELLVTQRGLNVGAWGTRAEPRRSGYQYNWARSGATSEQMLRDGQLDGVLGQVESGAVSHVVIQIGINDFYYSGLGQAIYDGEMGQDEVESKLTAIAGNIIETARTLQETGRVQLIVAAVPNYLTIDIVPEMYTAYSDPVGQQRMNEAFVLLNDKIRQQAEQLSIHFFDYNAAYRAELDSRSGGDGLVVVGDETINLRARGNNPGFGLLDDQYVHPGTVLSGLAANIYIDEFNRTFGTTIARLSDEEILQAAGFGP